MEILVLCTGNICRSPMAEALLGREIRERAGAATVASAGFVTEGRPAEPNAEKVMATRRLRLDVHRSRLVTEPMLETADLVLGMTRDHVRRAVTVERDVFDRTFTLKELVRRGGEVGPVPDGDLAGWLTRIAENREPTDLLGQSDDDDIADPMGRSLRRFRSCAKEIEEHVLALAELLWPEDAAREPGQ